MTRLAVEEIDWAIVSDFEARSEGPSYSWQTASHFHARNPDANLFWLLGVDQWQVIETWAESSRLASLLTFIVFAREGRIPQEKQSFRSVFVHGTIHYSATAIREEIAAGMPPDGLDHRVASYIEAQELYKEGKRKSS